MSRFDQPSLDAVRSMPSEGHSLAALASTRLHIAGLMPQADFQSELSGIFYIGLGDQFDDAEGAFALRRDEPSNISPPL